LSSTYFVAIAATSVLLSLLALVAYAVNKISPCSFLLSVALTRVFSFSVEMRSRAQHAEEVTVAPLLDGAREGMP
jgi:hypothetical protein